MQYLSIDLNAHGVEVKIFRKVGKLVCNTMVHANFFTVVHIWKATATSFSS
jgi:hypothetical protein